MEIALRSIDLSKVVLEVTFSKPIELHGRLAYLIKFNHDEHLMVAHKDDAVEPLSRHRLKSVIRIRYKNELALLLQIASGKHILWEKIDISDDIFKDINRGHYCIERTATQRLMLVEDSLCESAVEMPRKRRRRCIESVESEDELLS